MAGKSLTARIAVTSLAILLLLGARPAHAECMEMPEAESLARLAELALVFEGEILSVTRIRSGAAGRLMATARIIDLHKGEPATDVVAFFIAGGTIRGREVAIEPGYELAEGDRFEALLLDRNGRLVQADVCSRPWPEHLDLVRIGNR